MHYANGREAKVGDPVVGKVYNTPGIVAGTLVSLTPGQDTCSAEIEFVTAISDGSPRMPVTEVPSRRRLTQQHGSAGPWTTLYLCRDYTHAGNLLHAEDAHDALTAMVEQKIKPGDWAGKHADKIRIE